MGQAPAGFVPDGFEPDAQAPAYQPRNVLTEGRVSAATSGKPEGDTSLTNWFQTQLRPQLEPLAHPMTLDDIGHLLMAPTDATRSVGVQLLGKVLKRAVTAAHETVQRAKSPLADALQMVADSGGNPLKLGANIAGKGAEKLRAVPGPSAAETAVADVAQSVPSSVETPIQLTRRLKTEWLANRGVTLEQAKAEAYQPVGSPQAPLAAQSAPASTFTPSPLQKMFGMKPGVEPSPTQLSSSVRLAEIRAKATLTAAEKTAVTDLVKQGTAPEAALSQIKPTNTVTLYHGNPGTLQNLNPGSMLTDDPSWASGYTTKQINGIGPDVFSGKVHAVDVSLSGKTLKVNTLSAAETKLIDLYRQATGKEAMTLKEAADVVHQKYGYDAIIAQRADGSIAGAIPLKTVNISHLVDPANAVADAVSAGKYVPDNMRKALELSKSGDPAAELARRLGTPSVEDATKAVAERNRTGRWPKSPNSKQLAAKADRP